MISFLLFIFGQILYYGLLLVVTAAVLHQVAVIALVCVGSIAVFISDERKHYRLWHKWRFVDNIRGSLACGLPTHRLRELFNRHYGQGKHKMWTTKKEWIAQAERLEAAEAEAKGSYAEYLHQVAVYCRFEAINAPETEEKGS